MVDDGVRQTAEACGFEGTPHGRRRQRDRSEAALFEAVATDPLPPTVFTGKRVLDAGCGRGRSREVAAHLGAATVVGCDLHDGVSAAHRLTAPLGTVPLARATLVAPPLRRGRVEAILSIGVVHQTGDAHRAIRGLVAVRRPGGPLCIQV